MAAECKSSRLWAQANNGGKRKSHLSWQLKCYPSCSKDHTICLQKDLLCTSLITLCKKGWMYDTRTNLWQATLKDYILALRNSYISMPLGKSHTKDFVTSIGHSLVLYLTFNSYSKDRACSAPSSNRSLFFLVLQVLEGLWLNCRIY